MDGRISLAAVKGWVEVDGAEGVGVGHEGREEELALEYLKVLMGADVEFEPSDLGSTCVEAEFG
ncbi:hypothetical protein ABZ705_06505 [Streptomyces sp. NPDC006984]|uniref:hypothetical protein n=1 Tax=Streptomyces sp. NPDC006984 TaxID=3155463 RepID=UPI0033C690AB